MLPPTPIKTNVQSTEPRVQQGAGSVSQGSITQGPGSINQGSGTINYNYYARVSEEATLIEARLNRIDQSTMPSGIRRLSAAVEQFSLVVLYAPDGWGQEYVAEHLAYQLVANRPQNSEDAEDSKTKIFAPLTTEAGGSALLSGIRQLERDKQTQTVILALNVERTKYERQLHEIDQAARDHEYYVIITTTESPDQWDLPAEFLNRQFFNLQMVSPYSDDDLADWLCRGLEPILAKLLEWKVVEAADLTPNTPLNTLDRSIHQLAKNLKTPGSVNTFVQLASSAQKPEQLKGFIQEASQPKGRIKRWFDSLLAPERHLVLAISLIDGLPQETFWAIYEQLAQRAWRVRDVQLAMSDYFNIDAPLDEFVEEKDHQVRFRNPDDRVALVNYALDRYRRALIQALPILADIISRPSYPVEMQAARTGLQTEELRALDIFGSSLEPIGENYRRQERLRNSLVRSIAQIAQREQVTTENLLLTWAQSDNLSLQTVVAQTIAQMFLLEPPSKETQWDERYYCTQLLSRWYKRYFYDFPAESWHVEADKRASIRATLAMALGFMGRYMSEAEFGNLDETRGLLGRVPDTQPLPEQIKSPWHLLSALAWDSSADVRFGVAYGLAELAQTHVHHAETLTRMLATDWQRMVRNGVAFTLRRLVVDNSDFLYMVNNLLDQASGTPVRTITDKEHYLYQQANVKPLDYSPQIEVGTWAMLLIGQDNPPSLAIYLHTYLQGHSRAYRQALGENLERIVTDQLVVWWMTNTALRQLLLDRGGRNEVSIGSRILGEAIRRQMIHSSVTRSLVQYYEKSDDPEVRARIKQIQQWRTLRRIAAIFQPIY